MILNPYRFSAAGPANPGTTNLVSYFSMEEASGNLIDSEGSNDLTVSGTVTYSTTGKVDDCLDFGTNAAGTNTTSTGVNLTGDISLSFWLNADVVESGDLARFAGVGETEATNALWFVNFASGGDMIVGHEHDAGVNQLKTWDTNLAADTWYHLAMVRDATALTWTLYVDGSAFGTPYTYTKNANGGASADLVLGYSQAAYDGQLDEFAIFNDVLSADEVSWLYNSGSGRAYREL